ncbi:flippase-like domain-containing protein [Clostridium sp. CM028]|uniref:lysylphosphatidylglycerol synthase transmembrane domain-containing protein n=1 Tax=Clostridium TaxID=1485 RepID=UPI0013EEDFBC|nr:MULTISPECIES: lysylphosphatidylglycerol synthase transmembrane domain-containing protein [Clostridium]MBU3093435.1 flippase-like domain-containing protein [Clostridium sp. CF011]MBW9146185.1 flippase-like domain-containing protein [Clostridium sp. CM027]MBW9149657.1 flippase-like domain-containing protein [Clostridium sp. CM028]MBZ9606339.1 flippase-like domain-containing protein [Clostridium estertheticum]UVE39834.1 flippase-like domain-containing protein [Clostridium sp. CM027]
MKKYKFNIILGIASGVIFVLLIIFTNGWMDLIHQMKNLQIQWIFVAVISMMLYWIFEAKTLQSIILLMKKDYKFKQAFKVTMVGQYFNSITPFASGGQPMQLYSLTKQKLGAGKSGSALMIKFIIYQTILTIYSLILIFWKAAFFKSKMSNLFYLIGFGFTVNASVIICLIIFSKYRKLTRKLIIAFSKVLGKFRVVKNISKLEIRINENLDQFHDNMEIVKHSKGLMLKAVVYTVFQLTIYFSIPYFIYLSFGMKGASIGSMIAATAFVIMLTAFIPLPGAIGGAEGAFYMFFSLFFVSNNIMAAILLWRIITFYSCIIFGFYATVKN